MEHSEEYVTAQLKKQNIGKNRKDINYHFQLKI